jgi:hypothetical protein
MPKQDDGLLAQHLHHQSSMNANGHFWHRLRWRWVQKRLHRLRPARAILDLGAGAGVAGNYLKHEPEYQYWYAEPIPSLRKKLQNDFGSTFDLTDSPKYSQIEVVLMLDVLEHIEDDAGFLKNLFGKMDFGSDLLLLVPARQELWSAWDTKLGHYRRYNLQRLYELASEAGFEIRDLRYIFPEFYILGMFRKYFIKAKKEKADLPVLSTFLNDFVYCCGLVAATLLPRPPLGSSAFLHVRKK